MGFPKQEYWSELLFPSPGDLPNPGIKPVSPALAGRFLITTEQPGKPHGRDERVVKLWHKTGKNNTPYHLGHICFVSVYS